jgi:glucuronate isomerase
LPPSQRARVDSSRIFKAPMEEGERSSERWISRRVLRWRASNDQIDGMTRQIEALSQLGLLSRFIGMVTDSRSFLSYTRHEYFRRLLCNILGHDMRRGLIPDDEQLVGAMVADICHGNAARYFGWE